MKPDTVLILTNKQDIHADLVLREIQRRGRKIIRFHPDEFPRNMTISVSEERSCISLKDPNISFTTEEIRSVWYRRPRTSIPHGEIQDPVQRKFIVEESQHLIENVYMVLEDALWVNPYFANIRGRYKNLQRKLATQIGLEMPDAVTTNDPDVARDFIAKHNGDVVYKSVRSGIVTKPDGGSDVIFTNKVTPEDIQEIGQVHYAPCVFMKYIEKKLELRVIVVGDQLFSAAIFSQESENTIVDWRKGNARYEPFNLPKEIVVKLKAFMDAFHLQYGAFDLILTPDGRFVMLELNPNGQWAFVQGFTGLPIAEALANLLTGASS